jgi:flagellar basal-body rod protein FlgB
MFENVFGIHEQALLVHGQRLGVLAANLANADTPGYKARDIDFGAVLAHTQGETQMPLQVTHAAHITFDTADAPLGDLKYRNPYQASLDGNTVEMPVEQAARDQRPVAQRSRACRYSAYSTFPAAR